MTTTPDTPPPPPQLRIELLDVLGMLDVIEVAVRSLDGDGTTATMPDVTPEQAVRWIIAALIEHGYVIVRTVPA